MKVYNLICIWFMSVSFSLQGTLLHDAARTGNIVELKKLINENYYLNVQDIYGDAPLHVAVRAGYYEVVKILIDAGASINIRNIFCGYTPLHCASISDSKKDIVELVKSSSKCDTRPIFLV